MTVSAADYLRLVPQENFDLGKSFQTAQRGFDLGEGIQKKNTLADVGLAASQGDMPGATAAAFKGGQPELGLKLSAEQRTQLEHETKSLGQFVSETEGLTPEQYQVTVNQRRQSGMQLGPEWDGEQGQSLALARGKTMLSTAQRHLAEAHAEFYGTRGQVMTQNADTKRIKAYGDIIQRYGDDPAKIDPQMWEQDNQPGGFIQTTFGRPIPFEQRDRIIQMAQARSADDGTPEGLDTTKARMRTLSDFSSGKAAANIRSLNTVMGHLDSLDKSIEGLHNTDGVPPAVRRVTNPIAEQFSPRYQAALGDFNTKRQAVATELMRVFRETGVGSLKEIEDWKRDVGAADSPTKLHSVVRSALDLVSSRMSAINDQWNRVMGSNRSPREILSPDARAIFDRLSGGEAPAAQKPQGRTPQGGPARIKTDADYDALPPGSRFVDPNGQERVKPGKPSGMMRLAGPTEAGQPQQPQQAPTQNGGDTAPSSDEIMSVARDAGYQGNSPEEAMQAIWEKAPSDQVGDALERFSQRAGLRPPWHQDFNQGRR